MQIVVGILAIIFLVVFPIITLVIYNGEFGHRYEERRYESYRVENFKGLQVERCSIVANKGHRLAGKIIQKSFDHFVFHNSSSLHYFNDSLKIKKAPTVVDT